MPDNFAYECAGCGHLALRHHGSGEWLQRYPAPLDRKFACQQCSCVLKTGAEMVGLSRADYTKRHLPSRAA